MVRFVRKLLPCYTIFIKIVPVREYVMVDLYKLINDFFLTSFNKKNIYNERSFQLELTVYLRKVLPEYYVHIEKSKGSLRVNGNLSKKGGIDIAIFNDDKKEKYAVELKYGAIDAGVPAAMFNFVEDVKVCEELKAYGFTDTCCVTLVNNSKFYKGDKQDGIYKYFRVEHSIYGVIEKHTAKGSGPDSYTLNRVHDFEWKDIPGQKEKYYVIRI